jgi:glycerol-3-phosphate dehydrogenase (NAD(P)+)
MTENFPGKIAVMGGGSWATALSKLLLNDNKNILWYMRRDDRIEDFKRLGHNPTYLSDVTFDIDRIKFSSDINAISEEADTIMLAMPSPYIKDHLKKMTADISGKYLVSAVKGMVPEDNVVITKYMHDVFHVATDHLLVVSGPCHAEEVALERLSYLTVGSQSEETSRAFAKRLTCKTMKTVISTDVDGIEYAAVLKNVYAIAAGMVHGIQWGDNFLAMLMSNAIREMERFMSIVIPRDRNICDSVYLGDLLVTGYSRFSRNHNFGAMLGRGYSVKAAMMEMEMVAEGYYGTKCIHEINEKYKVSMPILEEMYNVLYKNEKAMKAITVMADEFV